MKVGFTPAPEELGERVDVVIARRAGVSRVAAQDALRRGRVVIGGKTAKPSHRLEAADVVAGIVELPEHEPPAPEDIPIEVRYEDARVLAISKPAGVVTHPAHGHRSGTVVNALLALGVPLAGRTEERPGIVHRLDKDTSGLLLVAKDDAARAWLATRLKQRQIKRTYLALVRGVPAVPTGTVDAPVGRHRTRRWLMAVVPEGRAAVTHYRVLDAAARCALVSVTLETGRTHQIRVHLSHLGHPVLGDATYGGASEFSAGLGLDRPFLHAWRLEFPHPDDGRAVEVEDPLPQELREVLARAGVAW